MKNIIKIYVLVLCLLFIGTQVYTQDIDNDFEYRTSFKLSFKPLKQLKLNFVPEIRFNDDFSVDQYQFEVGLVYKPAKILYLSGGYRFVVNSRDEKSTEYLHRYEIGASLKKDFDRFEPELRFQFTNYADDDIKNKYLRYKAALGYNIKDCRLTPTLSAELFQQLSEKILYKVRYKLMLEYKVLKNNYIRASYRLDYYIHENKNKHIFSLGYKIKL